MDVVEETIREEESRKRKRKTNGEKEGGPVKKKHKKKEKREEEEITPVEIELEGNTPEIQRARLELKNLMLKYPDADINDMIKIEETINQLNSDELKTYLRNLKIKIGLNSPNESSRSIIGLIGIFIQNYTGHPEIYERLSNDEALLSAVEHVVPSTFGELNLPLQIVYRVAGHLCDVIFKQNHFSK